MDLLARRWLVVLGKGGVGRTTVSLALALALADHGRRVALVEVNGASSLAELTGLGAPHPVARSVARRLDLISLDAAGCLEAYVVDRMGVAPFARLVLHHGLVSALLDALPGMTDLLHHGMIHSLVDPSRSGAYDVVVIDAPATGHGLVFVQTPSALRDMTMRGPIYEETALIAQRLEDPTFAGALLVTLAEELPTLESLELVEGLGPWRRILSGVVVNRVFRAPLPEGLAWSTVRAALADRPALVAVGERRMARVERQSRAIDQLVAGLGAELPVSILPRLPGPLALADARSLAAGLAPALHGGGS